jgi:hypothetical protein
VSTSFEKYWETIEKRNGWSPDTVVEVKVSGLKKLAEQAYRNGAENSRKASEFVDKIIGRGLGL